MAVAMPIGPSPKLISHDMEAADTTNFAGGAVPVPTPNLVAILRMPAPPFLRGRRKAGDYFTARGFLDRQNRELRDVSGTLRTTYGSPASAGVLVGGLRGLVACSNA
jgi:hypothetical protein